MWISTKKPAVSLSKEELRFLLGYHQTAEWNALNAFGHQQNILAGGMIALIAGGGAALTAEAGDEIKYLCFVLPTLVVILRGFAVRSLDRYYRRFLEAVTTMAKLEFAMALHRPVHTDTDPDQATVPFFRDETLEVGRRWVGRSSEPSSGDWIYKRLKAGHNAIANGLFGAICIGSGFVTLAAWLLLRKGGASPIPGIPQVQWLDVAALAALIVPVVWYKADNRGNDSQRRSETLSHG